MTGIVIQSHLKKAYVPVAEFSQKLALFAVVFTLLGGCDPSCESTCRKVLDCDGLETNELSIGECTAECVRQTNYYDDAEDKTSADALVAHKRCLKSSSCDEILDGVCYDEDLFGF